MAGNDLGGWSVHALKQYVDRVVSDHVRVHRAEMKERDYARRGINRRLSAMDRQIMESQRRELNYLTRVDYERHHDDLGERLERQDKAITDRLDRHEATSDERFKALETWKATIGGRTVAVLFVVGLFSGVIGVVVGHIFFG